MNNKEYIRKLREYTSNKNISVYDYYYALGTLCRKYQRFNLLGFEAENPFLSAEDYKKLLSSSDELMPVFFARAMTKVIELNEQKIAEEEVTTADIREVIEAEYEKVGKVAPKEVRQDDKKAQEPATEVKKAQEPVPASQPGQGMMPIGKKCEALVPYVKKCTDLVPYEKNLSKDDIRNAINAKLESIEDKKVEKSAEEGLSRTDIASAINAKLESVDDKKSEEAPREESISRADIAASVNAALDNLTDSKENTSLVPVKKPLSKEDIIESITAAMKKIDAEEAYKNEQRANLFAQMQRPALPPHQEESAATKSEPRQPEKPKKKGLFNLTSINLGIIDKLKGLALIRESKTGKADIYLHDPQKDVLKGRTPVKTNAESGYYVNFQEYIYKMIDSLRQKYPNVTAIRFVDEEGNERTNGEVVEEVFKTLREAGAIRFGEEYAKAKINTYEDLRKIKPGYGKLAGEKLRKGIFVRRDLLREELRKYKFRVYLPEEAKTYKKTK